MEERRGLAAPVSYERGSGRRTEEEVGRVFGS